MNSPAFDTVIDSLSDANEAFEELRNTALFNIEYLEEELDAARVNLVRVEKAMNSYENLRLSLNTLRSDGLI